MSHPIHYEPAVPDGPDCPWTRQRTTRWWLVIPADLISVVFIASCAAAAMHDLSQMPELLVLGTSSVALGWLLARLLNRPDHHLEAMGLNGWIVLSETWVMWIVGRGGMGGFDSWGEGFSFAAMIAAFLIVIMGGWRWLYGFAKAQESLTPRALARRMASQEMKSSDDALDDLSHASGTDS